jgi:hypothetical protein
VAARVASCVVTARAVAQTPPPAPCTPSGGLSFVCGIQNGEDLVLVPNTRWLIASGMAPAAGCTRWTRRPRRRARSMAPARRPAARSHDLRQLPGPLDPKQMVLHGLSLRAAAGGRYTVYATNHGGRESIEVFEIAPAARRPRPRGSAAC